VFTFELLLSLLEDSGYLNAAAYLADSVMRPLGLNGRAIIPMISGTGCNVQAILGTRILASRRERFIASALIALVPCSARIAVILGSVGAVSGWVAAAGLGVVLLLIMGAVGVFLPIASFFGQTFNWLTPGLSGSTQTEGIILLVVSGLAILLGLLSLLVPRTWARVLAGIIGLLAGALIAFDGLRNIPTMNELAGSAGTGLYVLGAAGVALVIFSLIVLFRRRA